MLYRLFFLLAVFCLIFNTVRLPLGGISPSDVFIFAALVVWAIEYFVLRQREGWELPLHPLWISAILVLVGGLVSSIFAVTPTTSVSISIKTAFVLSVWVSMAMIMVRQGALRSVLWTYVLAAMFTSSVALVQRFVTIGPGLAIAGRSANYWERSTGTVGHPVELGFVTSVAMPLALGLLLDEWQTRKRRNVMLVLGVGVLLIAAAIFFAGAVSGWTSTAITTTIIGAIFLARSGGGVRRAFVIGVAVLAVLGVVYLADASRREQVMTMVEFNLSRATTRTGPGRFELLDEALGVIATNPVIGRGMDQTGTGGSDELATSDVIHNAVLGGWLGGGIGVFLGLIWAYLIVFLTALNTLRFGVRERAWVLVGLGACMIGWMIFDQTQTHLYHRYTWLTLGLAFGLGAGVRVSAPVSRNLTPSMPAAPPAQTTL